jgi:hypothetical protein
MYAKKGFIHIMEIIIIVIVMFIVLFQFSLIQTQKSDWSRAKLAIQGYDILFSLDRQGVDWTATDTALRNSVIGKLNNMDIQKNIIYSLRVEFADRTEKDIIENIVKNPVTVSIFRYASGRGAAEIILEIGNKY